MGSVALSRRAVPAREGAASARRFTPGSRTSLRRRLDGDSENLSRVAPGQLRRPGDGILHLQRTLGNHVVSQLLQSRAAAIQRAPEPVPEEVLPSWDDKQLRHIQRELKRLGLYTRGIDGIFGSGTRAALIEAFGGEDWRTRDPDDIVEHLEKAKMPTGAKAGQHRLRYGELFKDGILDMTFGVGYDEQTKVGEKDLYLQTADAWEKLLTDRGFADNKAGAEEVLNQHGRNLGPSAFGHFYLKKDAITYQPPAEEEARKIHAVGRVIVNETGAQGAQASAAFKEGMEQSDVSYYAGHGRYGSGPDFDKNFQRFELTPIDKSGDPIPDQPPEIIQGEVFKDFVQDGKKITYRLEGYEELESRLRQEGAPHGRGAWGQFQWREKRGLINVVTSNAGNVYINPQDLHASEFGARLIYWSLEKSGAKPVTGKEGELAQAAEENPERKYKVWVFDGCRTKDYEKSVRGTPSAGKNEADVFETKRTVSGYDDVATFAAFLDSILDEHESTAEQIVKNMDATQTHAEGGVAGGTFVGTGQGIDPVVK